MKIVKYIVASLLTLILLLLLILLIPSLWNRWVTYPRLEKEIATFQALRKESAPPTTLNTYRGVMHVHSYLSHDSKGVIEEILPAAKADGIDFIFFTDHPRNYRDTLPKGYKGYYDGVLMEPGSEMDGFDTWPLKPKIFDWKRQKDSIAHEVVSEGGIVFYAHTEEPHNWGNPDYQGMEIYNFHTDTKDENYAPIVVNFILNGNKYRPWALREMFDEQTTILARWDSLNKIRKIVGFSAVDTHENQNFRARYLPDGRVQWFGLNAHKLSTWKVGFWNRWMFHQPDAGGWIFKFMVDTYLDGFNYITNYVVADSLTVSSLAEHLKKGHLYTAFKSLGDAKGFSYIASDGNEKATALMGDSVKIGQFKILSSISPLPGQFRLIHDGKEVYRSDDKQYVLNWSGPFEKGAYRIEIHIPLLGDRVPWLYSNPIYVY